MGKLIVVAIGGNSIIKDNAHVSIADQYAAICQTAVHIVDLVEQGHNVVVSHGNGPQVGFILKRAEIAAKLGMHYVPLVNCDADTQGAIGYQIQQALDNEFRKRKLLQGKGNGKSGEMLKTAVTIVTQVQVDKDDPAFDNPTKPIGEFYREDELKELQEKNPDWTLVEDSGRGYRRVVPSPLPIGILELEAIETLLNVGFCVIAAGGGGIPVVKNEDDQWVGIDAVIDKDRATRLLANDLNADVLVISTGVAKVFLNFGKENEVALDKVKVSEMKKYIKEGHFAPGSMLPKIESAIMFVEKGGKEAIITSPEFLEASVGSLEGTHIIAD